MKKGTVQKDWPLGVILRDQITKFSGTAVSRIEYINGCVQYCLQPKCGDDGQYPEGKYFERERLEYVKGGVTIVSSVTGGPTPEGTPSRYQG